MKKSNRIKLHKMKTSEFILHFAIVFFAVLNLFPLYWMFISTLKYSHDVTKMPPDWIPKRVNYHNYVDIFTSTNIGRWFLNSVIVASVSTLLVIIVSSMSAYSFAKLKYPGSKLLFWVFISALMLPKESYVIPLFVFISDVNLTNTYTSMIIPVVALPFGTFLLKSFFQTIPDEIRESAKIDGANELMIFAKIMLPMVTSGIGALAILMFVRCWNDYLWQLLMAQSDAMKTVIVGVASLIEDNRPDMARKLTGAAISAIPMLIVFFSFQKYFTKGVTIGAVKG